MKMMQSDLMTRLTTPLRRRSALRRLAGGALTGLAAMTAPQGKERVLAQEATPAADGEAFVVIRRYQLTPASKETADLIVQRVTDGFLPIIRAIPGFREYILVDSGEGEQLTISLFANEEGAAASTANAADWAAANVRELLEGPPEVTEGWVRIHVTA